MRSTFYCISNTGFPVTPRMHDEIVRCMRKMYERGDEKLRLKSDEFELRLYTEYESMLFVTITGILFNLIIESDQGVAKIRCIVQESILTSDDDFTVERIPVTAQSAEHARWN